MSETNNNRYNDNRNDTFREGYRRVFGSREPGTGVKTGKWVATPEGLVPVEQYGRPKARQLIKVMDDSMSVPVTRIRKNKAAEDYVERGFRTI